MMTEPEWRKLAEEYGNLFGSPPCADCDYLYLCTQNGNITYVADSGAAICEKFAQKNKFNIRNIIEAIDRKKDQKKMERTKLLVDLDKKRRFIRRRRAFAREIAREIAKELAKVLQRKEEV